MKYKKQLIATFHEQQAESKLESLDLAQLGEKVIVMQYHDLFTDRIEWGFMADNGKGIPVDNDNECFVYHGWCGAEERWACHGYGLREVKGLTLKNDKDGHWIMKVYLGPDLVPDLQ